MTSKLTIHPLTEQQLQAFVASDAHAVVLVGPTGVGKRSLARKLGSTLLELKGELDDYPHRLLIGPTDGKAIGIEAIRELDHFLRLKVPGRQRINRLVLIEEAQLLTIEAQNALLKTLEEPPAGSVLIMTADSEQHLLQTIRSRAQIVSVKRPNADQLSQHFASLGHDANATQQAFRVSGGLPGLMSALLADEDHPVRPAIETARQLLQQTQFERLAQVDSLSKQKDLAQATLLVLQQMSRLSLQTATATNARRWQRIMKASYRAHEALAQSGQPKLVLTDFMLAF